MLIRDNRGIVEADCDGSNDGKMEENIDDIIVFIDCGAIQELALEGCFSVVI